jgi:succinate dehydrogenase / fumarate reductase, membrane anchor subunit
MPLLTDRKRAEGMGSARAGTHHHWQMTLTSAALVLLVPLFIFTFGRALGMGHDDALAYYARPFPAIVGALTILVGMVHFRGGVQVLIEDYVHGDLRKLTLLGAIGLAYTLAAVGLFAIARIAL